MITVAVLTDVYEYIFSTLLCVNRPCITTILGTGASLSFSSSSWYLLLHHQGTFTRHHRGLLLRPLFRGSAPSSSARAASARSCGKPGTLSTTRAKSVWNISTTDSPLLADVSKYGYPCRSARDEGRHFNSRGVVSDNYMDPHVSNNYM